MEEDLQQQHRKKPDLIDVPVTGYTTEVPPKLEAVAETSIQLLSKVELEYEVSNQSSAGDSDKVNITTPTSFYIDEDSSVDQQHSTSQIIHLPVSVQHSHFKGAELKSESSELDQNFPCLMCNKTYKNSSYLKRHINIHTGERIYKCDLCEKTFLDASVRTRHRKIHSGDKPWSCKICKKSFGTLGSLRRHITVHIQEGRPYHCETCKKRFPDNSSYQKHKLIHTGMKPYVCEVCHKAFVNIGDLNGHRKIHVVVKPYNCERCGMGFAKHSNYVRHLRIHEGDSKFSCTVCGVSYNFETSLTRHLKTHVRRGKNAAIKQKAESAILSDDNSELFKTDALEETTDDPSEKSKMKHLDKIKQLHILEQQLQPVKQEIPFPNEVEAVQPVTNETTEPQTETEIEAVVEIDTTQTERDPTVLPPQEESLSRQKTTEDVTSLLTCEDFGSTKDVPQALLPPMLESLDDVLSLKSLSILPNMCKNEYILSTLDAGDILLEVQNTENSGTIISDNDSVITIISISENPVAVAGIDSVEQSFSVDDTSHVADIVLESSHGGETMFDQSWTLFKNESPPNGESVEQNNMYVS